LLVPTAPGFSCRGRSCCGVCVTGLDRERLDPVQAGLHLVQAFHETHPQRYKAYEGFVTELGDREAWGLLTKSTMMPEKMLERWNGEMKRFLEIRELYLIYDVIGRTSVGKFNAGFYGNAALRIASGHADCDGEAEGLTRLEDVGT